MAKKLSTGERVIRNFKRVLTTKSGNYNFPQKVVEAVYADRSTMTAQEKAKQTRYLQSYAKDRYRKLYKETYINYGEVQYSVKEWKSIPKEQRKSLEEDYGKWSKDTQPKPKLQMNEDTGQLFDPETGEIFDDDMTWGETVYANFVEEFLNRIQGTEMPDTFEHNGRVKKRWKLLIEQHEQAVSNLVQITQDQVEEAGADAVGLRLAQNADIVSDAIAGLHYASTSSSINLHYSRLATILTSGNLLEQDMMSISESEEYNGVYN